MSNRLSKGYRYCLKIPLTPEEKLLVWKIFGPDRAVSIRIKEVLLNPYARRNPDQWRELIEAMTRIESILEVLLRSQKPQSAEGILDFLQACYSAHEILNKLRKYAI
jgi:hypothetical protein